MFDRVSDMNLTGGSDAVDADEGELSALLGDGSELVHVLANDGALEHTDDGRTTTVEPSSDVQAYVLVTDERVLYVFDDGSESPEIEIDLREFRSCHHRKGLLSSKLEVKTHDESVQFAPDEGDVEAVTDYIKGVGSAWADMTAAIAKARASIAEFEDRCEQGKATGDKYLAAKSNLSEARRCTSREDRAPTMKMRSQLDEARADIERRHVTAWLDRAADRLDAVEAALDGDRWDDACEAYVDAAEALSSGRDAIDDTDADTGDAEDRLADLESSLETVGEAFLTESDATCEEALSADETTVAVDAWESAFDRYSAAVDAGWNGYAPVSGDALELQLTWVTASLLDALGSHASMLESRAEDCEDDDEAIEYFEEAEDWYERAGRYAERHPERDAAEFASAAERVEDRQLERAGWEFGNA